MPESLLAAFGNPLVILAVGLVTVVGMIIVLRVNAFIALITAAMLVSLLAPGSLGEKISRVAVAFGDSAGKIGIVIAMAAVIGKCLMDSGAADRIVRSFLRVLGEKRSAEALTGASFVLAVPVFFDTVFYLMVPLARSLWRSTQKNYVLYILAISTGAAVTHSMVPPTPGPLIMADQLGIDIGVMILIGAMIGFPTAIVGLLVARVMNRMYDIPCRPYSGEAEPEPLRDDQLPGLAVSLAPILLPVLLISANTVSNTMAEAQRTAMLEAGQLLDWPGLASELGKVSTERETPPAVWLADRLPPDLHGAVSQAPAGLTAEQRDALQTAVSAVVEKGDLYFEPAFVGIPLSEDARKLLDRGMDRLPKQDRDRFRKSYQSKAYAGTLTSTPGRKLVHQGLQELSTGQRQQFDWLMIEAAFPGAVRHTTKRQLAEVTALVGDANLALLLAAAIAMLVLVRQRGLTLGQLAKATETALMSGGVIILITAGGGAFGAMLKEAQVGPAVESMFGGGASTGTTMLVIGFAVGSVLKIAQGSSTVAMITASSMLAAMGATAELLGFHPAYLATAIAGGALVGSWMNDSGFWIFARMSGLTEVEALKSWTIILAIVGSAAFGFTLLAARLLPLV
jgi:gluconate:H+ symporter, GntP family